jgi:hypothetical protein
MIQNRLRTTPIQGMERLTPHPFNPHPEILTSFRGILMLLELEFQCHLQNSRASAGTGFAQDYPPAVQHLDC